MMGTNDVQVLPAPVARYRRHGRIPEYRRQRPAHALGFAVAPTDRLCSRYIPTPSFLVTEKAEAAGTQDLSVSWPSITQIAHGARHS